MNNSDTDNSLILLSSLDKVFQKIKAFNDENIVCKKNIDTISMFLEKFIKIKVTFIIIFLKFY